MTRSRIHISILLCCFFIMGCIAINFNAKDDVTAEEATDAATAAPVTQEETGPDPFAYTPPCRECDRATLKEAVESYIADQESGDPSKTALAADATFKENMSEVAKMDQHIRLPFGGVPCSRLEGGAYTNPNNVEKDK